MKKFCKILLFFLMPVFFYASADKGVEDRLEEISLWADDTVKASALYETGFALRNTQPVLAFNCALNVLKTAKAVNSDVFIAKAYSLMGILYYKKGDFESALRLHQQALAIREQNGDASECALSYINLGNVYSDKGELKLSERFHLKALSCFSSSHNEQQMMNCLNNLGVLKHKNKQFVPAQENLKMALTLAEKLNDYEARAMVCNNLGVLYEDQQKYEEALNYYFEVVKLRELMDGSAELADAYYNLGALYAAMKKNEDALAWFQKSLLSAKDYKYIQAQKDALWEMAEIYAREKNFEKAYQCMNEKSELDKAFESFDYQQKHDFHFPSENPVSTEQQHNHDAVYLSVIGVLAVLLLVSVFWGGKKISKKHEQEK